MKFQELNKECQSFLTSQFLIAIEDATNSEDIKDFVEPTYDEYKQFFNEYDENYEIIDEYPESVIESEFHNTYRIKFQGKKVILEVYPPHEFDD
jgi:hypothetical protein